MEKKNKIMLAAAIGAVVILIGSSVVRGVVSRGVEQAASDAPATEQAQTNTPLPATGIAGDDQEASSNDTSAALDILAGHVWQAKDNATKTAAFRDGMFVETDGTNVRVSAFTVLSCTANGNQKTLVANIVRDGDASASNTAIIIDGTEGAYTVTSDGFLVAKTYVQGKATGVTTQVSGLDDTYTALIDGKTDELRRAVSAYCTNRVPTATKVNFDGEVYIDTHAKSVAATFHCNDAASTILQVTYAGGAFTVAG